MIIEVEKVKRKKYRADLKDLPGSPSVGIGKSPEEAVAALFFVLLSEGTNWIRHLNLHEFEVISR